MSSGDFRGQVKKSRADDSPFLQRSHEIRHRPTLVIRSRRTREKIDSLSFKSFKRKPPQPTDWNLVPLLNNDASILKHCSVPVKRQ